MNYLFLQPAGHFGLMPVTFLTVLPLTQLIVLFDLLAPEPVFAGVVAVVDEPEEDPCVSFGALMHPELPQDFIVAEQTLWNEDIGEEH